MTPDQSNARWIASDDTHPDDLALRLLAAALSDDREGAAELVASWDGDHVALSASLLSWLGVLRDTRPELAGYWLPLVRRELLRRAGQGG